MILSTETFTALKAPNGMPIKPALIPSNDINFLWFVDDETGEQKKVQYKVLKNGLYMMMKIVLTKSK